ncbi:MAG: hypothetical protein Nkreftii_002672 [Candidatus Nitrospira kreftii]|uniref:Uncharacterized protein n=1 Tax=Candidatus Nitrospira kreftii TaxID=2652173 RepID=A0A7S8FFL2_9BACT|nr:MAG: hypothetical protein Nkreftii_002672 [Candidatus Nitrospira kreftii]
MLNDIRTVLEKHNYTERVGVCLLHRHFDLSNSEVLMEFTEKDRRVSEIVVERYTEPSKTKIQTMWKLSRDITAAIGM